MVADEHSSLVGPVADPLTNLRTKLEDLNATIITKNTNTNSAVSLKQPFLFFSFDIVNSTIFKSTSVNWPTILSNIFHRIRRNIAKSIDKAEVWRILGDEIVFVVHISSLSSLYKYVDEIFGVLQAVCADIESGVALSGHSSSAVPNSNTMLSLKATAWFALVNQLSTIPSTPECTYENISIEYELGKNRVVTEFLGNDIDEGFRLSKNVSQRRMVVNFALAHLLSQQSAFLDRLHIIDFVTLKGIWQDRDYPIIWYYNAEKSNNISFIDSFYYDETKTDVLSRHYFENRASAVPNPDTSRTQNMYQNTMASLKKVAEDQRLSGKLKEIIEVFGNCDSEAWNSLVKDPFDLDCAAVCFSSDNRVLVLQHDNLETLNHAGKYFFGGCQFSPSQDLASQIVKHYQSQYNVNIEVISDTTYDTPIPVRLAESMHNRTRHMAIIVVAHIRSIPSKLSVNLKTIADAEALDENDSVPHFKNSLRLANEIYQSNPASSETIYADKEHTDDN